jgi:hypothetical protein
VFIRGTDGQDYRSYNDGGGWSAWAALGGATVSAPAAVATSATRIDLWARAATGVLRHNVWQSSQGCSGWSDTWLKGPRR